MLFQIDSKGQESEFYFYPLLLKVEMKRISVTPSDKWSLRSQEPSLRLSPAPPSPSVCLFLLLPGRRRGTAICGRGDHQSPAGRLQPAPSCSPPPSCCSGTAESSGCSCNSDRHKSQPQLEKKSRSCLKRQSLGM